MLKTDEFNIFSLAQKNSFKRFVHFKVTLRDKIKYDIELLEDSIDIFENNNQTKHIIYACQTKTKEGQGVPPKYNCDFMSYDVANRTYKYETSTINILIECSNSDFKMICEDMSNNKAENNEIILFKALEYFAYKYNLAVSGNDFIDTAELCVGSFECYSYYRSKKTGEYEQGNCFISPAMSIIKPESNKKLTFQSIINTNIPVWKYFLNKTKYLYSIHNNLECVVNATIAIESYIVFLVKKAGKYEDYLIKNKNNLGYITSLKYARENNLVNNQLADMFENGYNKICKQRSLIVHGVIDSPIIDRENAKIAYETVVDIFMEIDNNLNVENSLSIEKEYFENDYNQMNNIMKKIDSEEYVSAIEDLNININDNIFYDLSIYNRAKCYSKIGKSSEAIKDFRTCIENRYRLIETYNGLGMELSRIGEHQEAKQIYLKAIELDSKYSEFYYNLGIEQHYLQEYDDAITSYNNALNIKKCACYYFNLGAIYCHKNDYDNTLKNYNQAIKLDSKNSRYLYERAFIYEILKRPKEAENDIIKCIKHYEGVPEKIFIRERLYQIGLLYQKDEKYNDAIRVYSVGCEKFKNLHSFYKARGNCFRNLNDFEKAKSDYEKCLEFETKSYNDITNIIYLYLDVGDFENAKRYIEELTNTYDINDNIKDCIDLYNFKCYEKKIITKDDFLMKFYKNHKNIKLSSLYKKLVSIKGEEETKSFFEKND